MATYVIGDLHGQVEAFDKMLSKISFDETKDKIYLTGDYTDGPGSNSTKLIMKLAELNSKNCLYGVLGNHDDMMLHVLKTKRQGKFNVHDHKTHLWQLNKGFSTLALYNGLSVEEQDTIYEFLDSLPLYIRFSVNGQKYYISHAERYNEEAPEEYALEDVLWGDHYNKFLDFLPNYSNLAGEDADTIFISGHKITGNMLDYPGDEREPFKIIYLDEKSRILMDCGCKGIKVDDRYRLGCLRLDDMTSFYVDAKEI